jgi:hypothetical protein
MQIDWKRKLTSRKFWAAVAGFVSMLLIYFGKDAGQTEQVAALIMAGASLVAYIIGEGLADGCRGPEDKPAATNVNPFEAYDSNDCKVEFGKDDNDE